MIRLLTLPAGFILDLLMGDPRWLYHPVCLIGNLISILEKGIRRVFPKTDKGERAGGILEVVLVCFITFFIPYVVIHLLYKWNFWLGFVLETFWCGQLLATKSLKVESMKVYDRLKNGTIEEDEKEYINNVFEFNDITASEIMTHRTDIFAVDINTSAAELLEEIIRDDCKHSRIPVYDETIDEIKGILYVKDIIKNITKKTFKIKNIMKEAYFVSQNKLINEIFKDLQKSKKQMAIVVDEYGGTAGLITMEDILEEIVGDIYDEYDDIEEEYEKIDDKTFMVSGRMPIYDVNKLLNSNIPEGDYDTLSGYLQEELGRIPTEEEIPIIETKELTFKIEEYEDKRIVKVKVCKNEPGE